MRINPLRAAALLIALIALPAAAEQPGHAAEHGGQLFHRFQLEADTGGSRDGTLSSWDFDGWIGGDDDKLWLKSEGERLEGTTESAEFWALWSHQVSEFWDVQAGLRHDRKPEAKTYATLGVGGLAPYLFETEAHLFISDEGDVSARIREENDLLLTQQLILQPYAEVNLFAQDVADEDVGAGLAHAEIGLQTRYEINRHFAPYIDLRYERAFGQTADIARANGEPVHDAIASMGLRLMF